MRSLFFSLILLGTAGMLAAAPSQEPSGPSTEVRSTTVLVDVVVRDRHGDPMTGLQASDFEVYEDGVLQDINHFESHTEGGTVDQASGTAGKAEKAAEQEAPVTSSGRFTALVFDRLSPNARDFARRASLAYLAEAAVSGDRIGVFFADLTPRTLQPYTENRARVEDAINRALGGTSSRQGSVSVDAASGTPGATSTADPGDLTLGSGAGAGGGVAVSAADSGTGGMSERMSSMARGISADRQGYATTNSLLAVVKSLQSIPGRKTILYFSEGVSIPPAIEARFRSVIDDANRANVSIYAIDAAGLRVQSTGSYGGNQITSASSRGGTYMASHDTSVNGEPLTRDVLERNETALRADAHGSMNRLADETGGLLLRETNDIEAGMQEVGQDMRNYYILGYTPKNGELDGTFRRIEVKTKVRDAKVRYRKGYYAIDRTIEEPIKAFERPVLALLDQANPTGSLPVRVSVLSFPRPEDPGFVTLLAEIPPGTLTYQPIKGDRSASDFAVVALVRDPQGNVVTKVSQRYRLLAPQDSSNPTDGILFYRELHLPFGRYQIELAGYDALTQKAGFGHAGLVLSEPDPTLPRLSSILLVGSAEPVGDQGPGTETPFHYQNILLYPNLSGRISKTGSKEMTFFFTVYPGNADNPGEAIIDVRRFNKPIEQSRIKLPAPDDQGRIQFASTLSTRDFQTGTYTLTVAVPAGEQVVARSCRFLLMP